MADRRMFAKSVVESARFLKMPATSQNLYFHLGMNADDDGVVEAYSVINLVKAHEDDLRVLYSKGFVNILNEDLVTYISDWREQNKLRADRKKDSIYKELLLQLLPDVELLEKKERSDLAKKEGQSMDGPRTAQCSVVEDRVVQDRLEECSAAGADTNSSKYRIGNESLSTTDYENLIKRYSKGLVESVIQRILSKPYHGCLNVSTISSWCEEHKREFHVVASNEEESKHSSQLRKLACERMGE